MKVEHDLAQIFENKLEPQEAGQRLLTALCLPGGMEKFVLGHNGKLAFSSISFDKHPGFLVYSSMTHEGRFVSEEGGVVWYDSQTGKQIPCYTMVLDEKIGNAVMKAYNIALSGI